MKKISVFFRSTTLLLITAMSLGSGFVICDTAAAQPPPPKGSAHMSVHHGGGHGSGGHPHGGGSHNTNVNVNVNNNGPGHGAPQPSHHDDHHHHDAGDVIAGALTGLAIGAIITAASMPPSCKDVVVNNISYRQCGNTWYQPYYSGTQVQFVVVNPPR